MAEPVFYDPRRARWKRLRRLFDVVAVGVSALILFFVYTALRDEPLPELLFSPQKRALKALKESERQKFRDHQKKMAARSHRKSKLAASQVKLNQEEGIRAGVLRSVGRGEFFSRCATMPARSTFSIPTGCMCLVLTDDCRALTTRPTSFSTWCRARPSVRLTIA